MLYLREPAPQDAAQVMSYQQEFFDAGERDNLDGAGGLEKAETFPDWYRMCQVYADPATVPAGMIPSTQLLAFNEAGELVGMLALRHSLNENLAQCGGHIGYSVRKSQRKKGYASQMLAASLPLAQALGLERVLVTCHKWNTASAKVILKNGGILENEVISPTDGEIIRRYWISLK